jgi:hypothetical protein
MYMPLKVSHKEFNGMGVDSFLDCQDLLLAQEVRLAANLSRERVFHTSYSYIYYSNLTKLFIQCPSKTLKTVTEHFKQAFDAAMEMQMAVQPQSHLKWALEAGKIIYDIDGLGNIKHRICADLILFGTLNQPYLALEVGYSQSADQVKEKADVWMSISSVVGVIVVDVKEDPSFFFPPVTTDSPPNFQREEWLKAIESCPDMGPIEVQGRTWAGKHVVTVSIHYQGEILKEVGMCPCP